MTQTNYYHEISNYYNHDASDYDSRYWSNPVLQQIRQAFREEVKEYDAQSMLEVGYGTGLDLVHFGKTHPNRKIYGIDISEEMLKISKDKVLKSGCANIEIRNGSVEEINELFPNQKFDIIYIFFGALNTVENINKAAACLKNSLNPGGIIVVSVVNKWYVMGMLLDSVRFRFKKALSRLKPFWHGYSTSNYLPSHCYTPKQIKKAFSGLKLVKSKGYSILHPAWYFTKINRKLGKLGWVLWNIDKVLNKTFLWRWGEYTLFVFQN